MATATRITLEQYLHTPCEPDAEFVNGEVEERNVGEYDHSVVQRAILLWFHRHDKDWKTRTIQEQCTRLRSGNVRIPDVSVWAREVPVQPVFSQPQRIAI
jgi:Putative restriction endonuclease